MYMTPDTPAAGTSSLGFAVGDPFGWKAGQQQATSGLPVGDPFGLLSQQQAPAPANPFSPVSAPAPAATPAPVPGPVAAQSATKPIYGRGSASGEMMPGTNYANSLNQNSMVPFTQAVAPDASNKTPGLAEISAMVQPNAGSAALVGNAPTYNPATMSAASYDAALAKGVGPIEAGQLSETNLQSYMNPYTQNVTDIALQDLARQNEILQNSNAAAAQAAGAFGGSRHGVAEAETNRAYLDQVARTTAQQNQNAFNVALGAAQFDIGNRLGADQFNTSNALNTQFANQAAQNAAGQYNAGNRQQASAFNAGAKNAAGQYNAGNQFQAALADQAAKNNMSQFNTVQSQNAANTLASIQNLGFGQQNTINNQLLAQGNQVQGLNQQIIDAANQQYQGFVNSPQQSLALLLSAINGVPQPISTTDSYEPGLLDIAGMFL